MKASIGNRIGNGLHAEGHSWKRSLSRYWQLYILLIPVVLNFVIFHYVPMAGIQIAFKDFTLAEGIWDSAWMGFDHFIRFFTSYNFWTILKNTLILSLLSLAFSFPLSIALALMLNEIRIKRLNSTLQTIFFAPHFVSTVVVVGMLQAFLSPSNGIVNILLQKIGLIEEGVYFTRLEEWFRPMYIISGLWQNVGWSSAIYISALSAIDTTMYEAASIDGASRWQQLWRITLPSIWPTIVIQLILKMGHIMSVGYEKVLLMQTSTNLNVSQIISTFVYEKGISSQQYDYATAIGLFNAVINLAVLLLVNYIAKKRSNESLW
ncbi:MAG: sugar ABC transporter permease [Oscillospiraceae bacterium]|nr:sugar ABC transporter permease [Oscillospiraceae bacterium]